MLLSQSPPDDPGIDIEKFFLEFICLSFIIIYFHLVKKIYLSTNQAEGLGWLFSFSISEENL